jgi:hypothetical protein
LCLYRYRHEKEKSQNRDYADEETQSEEKKAMQEDKEGE